MVLVRYKPVVFRNTLSFLIDLFFLSAAQKLASTHTRSSHRFACPSLVRTLQLTLIISLSFTINIPDYDGISNPDDFVNVGVFQGHINPLWGRYRDAPSTTKLPQGFNSISRQQVIHRRKRHCGYGPQRIGYSMCADNAPRHFPQTPSERSRVDGFFCKQPVDAAGKGLA